MFKDSTAYLKKSGLQKPGLERLGLEKLGLEKSGLEKPSLQKSNFKKFILAFVAAAGVIAAALPANAHHAFSAEFDSSKPIELTGVVTKAQWVNPHSWVYVDVKEANGEVANWGFEFGGPFNLKQKGLTKAVLPVGTVVTVKGYLSKGGLKYAYSTSIKLADGRVFQTGGAQDAPTTPTTNATPAQ